MHKLSEGFNKLVTGAINEQVYETRERALMYKDEKQRRDSAKRIKEGDGGSTKHKRNPSKAENSSLLEEDSAELIAQSP